MINGKFECRFCGQPLQESFVDLGMSPLANSYIKEQDLLRMEPFYPLNVFVCSSCLLVQLPAMQPAEAIFSDYAYFSSYSESWLRHAESYAEKMIFRFGFDSFSQVVEIASNDGYLLQYFRDRAIPVLGIEPAANVARTALDKGIPTIVEFFGQMTADNLVNDGVYADLLIGNNVLAHVPDINDFISGMKILLNANGIITMEFPHLMQLVTNNQFDTIYHEHFSYFSLLAVEKIFIKHGLKIFDVDEIPTHGGSIRIYACHSDDGSKTVGANVNNLRQREISAGMAGLEYYKTFSEKVKSAKQGILDFFLQTKRSKGKIACYGAPAKGNTLLNYCGIRSDFIEYTVDRSPHKQGLYLPGTHIPILAPEAVNDTKPDYLVILPWNLKDEIASQMAHIRQWGGKFVVLIPEVDVF